MATLVESMPVQTSVNYDILGPYELYKVGTAALLRDRQFDTKTVTVSDIRSQIADLSIDRQGFELHKHDFSFDDFDDEEKTQQMYWPQVSGFVKEKTGASEVVAFSSITRRKTYEDAVKEAEAGPDDKPLSYAYPQRWVHIDQSYHGAEVLLKDIFKDDSEKLNKKRWAIINVWRPLTSVVRKDPLALCDGRTVSDEDRVPKTVGYPQIRTGAPTTASPNTTHEVCAIKSNPNHKWYYVSNMAPDEALFIKIFDTKKDGRARGTPHTAFIDPRTEDDPVKRESIETRCFVFWDEPAE